MPRRRFQGDLESTRLYLESGFDIDQLFHGLTLLQWACSWSDMALVRLLLERGARTEPPPGATGKPAIMHAACSLSNASELISLLVLHRASLDARDHAGCTTLMHMCAHVTAAHCIMSQSDAIVDQLIAAGADINAEDNDGCTALGYYAWPKLCDCPGQDGRLAKRLITAGADVDTRADTKQAAGRTLLMHAAAMGKEELVRFCIAKGATIEIAMYGESRDATHHPDPSYGYCVLMRVLRSPRAPYLAASTLFFSRRFKGQQRLRSHRGQLPKYGGRL